MRYYGDVVVTWKINPKLTSITELNIVHDEGPFLSADGEKYSPTAGGAAQYLIWQWLDQLAVVGRAEIFRDANGFFVGGFPGSNLDFVNCEIRPGCVRHLSDDPGGGAPDLYRVHDRPQLQAAGAEDLHRLRHPS